MALRRTRPLRRTPLERSRAAAQSPNAHGRPLGRPKVRAAPEQREHVRGRGCIVCGGGPVDPAHIVPQWYRACGHPLGVIPLCRRHHVAYDWGGFDLLPFITDEIACELCHVLMHVRAGELLRGLQGGGWGDEERSGRNGTRRDPRPPSFGP